MDAPAPALDEKMDMASSPFHQVDVEDIDLEFDPVETQNLVPPSDNFMGDASDFGSEADDAMHGDSAELFEDQDMDDDGQGEVQLEENELDMGQDAVDDQEREDDLIYDAEGEDTNTADPHVQLEPPQPEIPTQLEEELFDFDDTDNIDNSAPDPAPDQAPTTEDAHELAGVEAQPETQPSPSDPAPDEHLEATNDPPHDVDDETAQVQEAQLQAVSELQDREEEQERHPDLNGLSAEAQDQLTQEDADNSATTSPVDDQAPSSIESLADTEINALGPHFVTLTYKDVQYPLFSDREAADGQLFPLSDTNLIFEPLEKLLEACKERVFTADQDHLDEVVFTIPVFAMKYCQDSKFASDHSLWDILRLYVKLKQNEGAKSIEPLNCALYVQTCLDTQFKWLISEAHKQLTYSDLHPDYVGVGNALSEPIGHAHDLSVDEEGSLESEEPEEEHGDPSLGVPEPAPRDAEAHESVEIASDESVQRDEESREDNDVDATDLAVDASTSIPEGDQAQADPPVVDDAAPAEEQAEQPSEFFDDAFDEDEQEADAVEDEEEQLEFHEDARALEQAEAANEQALETGHQNHADGNEQTDLSDEPQPFKIVEEVEEIALEEEDLTIHPQDPLGVDEDPDALLEGRPADTSSTDLENVQTNGSHTTKSASATESAPATPTKSKLAKRKAEGDDDDLLELDFDTPQTKRHRPSPP
ncbi:hypothetical protein DV737_g5203, partial [Chaetothyriales sp. CBS 132003]